MLFTRSLIFFIDGRHFKAVYGKDFVDGLISQSDAMLEELEKTVGDQVVSSQNRATCLQGQIDLIRSHQVVQDRRINYAVAREAEESDGRINERFVPADSFFKFFSLSSILYPFFEPETEKPL